MNHPVTDNSRGLVDMLDRIFKVLLNRPSFKKNIQNMLNNIDADAAPRLARTVLWEDMEFTFGLVAALPAIANTFILLGNEIVNQVTDKITPDLLKGFIESMVRDIDVETARELKQNIITLWNELEPVITAALTPDRDSAGSGQRLLEEEIHAKQ